MSRKLNGKPAPSPPPSRTSAPDASTTPPVTPRPGAKAKLAAPGEKRS